MFARLHSGKSLNQSFRIVSLCALVTLVLPGMLASEASAQNYWSINPKVSNNEARKLGAALTLALRNPADYQAGGEDKITKFFSGYFFPKMTSSNPKNLAILSTKYRETLFKRYLHKAQVKAGEQHLTDLSLKWGRLLSRGNFHPAVRYNAAIIVGQLDEQYATAGAGAQPPTPLPAATTVLVELLEQKEFAVKDPKTKAKVNVKVLASVKAAALVGLERHARFGISAELSPRLTEASLAVIAEEEPEEEVSDPVHHWMKCMAARVLARQYADGPTAEVHRALTGLIADGKMGLEDRCCAAELLDKLKYEAAAGMNGTATVLALGQLAQDVLIEEAKESEEFEEKALESGPVRRSGTRRNRFALDAPNYPRRRLLNRLLCIQRGSSSVAQGLPDEAQQNLQSLVDTLKPTISLVANKDSGNLDVTGAVQDLKISIDSLVNGWKPPEVDAAEEEEVEFTG